MIHLKILKKVRDKIRILIKLKVFKKIKGKMYTLKETSYDRANKEYMTEAEGYVINFDKVKEQYVRDNKLSNDNFIKSVDALACFNYLTFIEFKNGKLNDKDGRKIYDKLIGSLLIFSDITHKTSSYTRKNIDFILVYNSQKNIEYIKNYIDSKAKKSEFYKVEKIYFRKVDCYDKKQFTEFLKENNFI